MYFINTLKWWNVVHQQCDTLCMNLHEFPTMGKNYVQHKKYL